jgi:hypothetical protein
MQGHLAGASSPAQSTMHLQPKALITKPSLISIVAGFLTLLVAAVLLLHASSRVCSTISTRIVLKGQGSLPDTKSAQHAANATNAAHSWQPYSSTTAAVSARSVLEKNFPQYTRCLISSSTWQFDYAFLHSSITAGKALPKYLTDVACQKGVADRITGWVTTFYQAVLSNRAITSVAKSPLLGFEPACDMPYINWTNPFTYPDGALDLAYYNPAGEMNRTLFDLKEARFLVAATGHRILGVMLQN